MLRPCRRVANSRRARHRATSGYGVGAELNLSGDEERRVQQRFGNHVERRFTFETRRVAPGSVAPPGGLTPHVFAAFDQTDRHSADAGTALQKIQPLANRRRLVYRITTHSLDLEPALGGILAEYSSLASLAVGTKVNSYQSIRTKSLRHGFERLRGLFPGTSSPTVTSTATSTSTPSASSPIGRVPETSSPSRIHPPPSGAAFVTSSASSTPT